jgi:hypothetical protein
MSHFLFFAQNVTFTFASVFTGQTMLSVMYFYPYMYSERPPDEYKTRTRKVLVYHYLITGNVQSVVVVVPPFLNHFRGQVESSGLKKV